MNVFKDELGHKYRIKTGVLQVCAHGSGWRNVKHNEEVPWFVDVNLNHLSPEQSIDVSFPCGATVLNTTPKNVLEITVPKARLRFD